MSTVPINRRSLVALFLGAPVALSAFRLSAGELTAEDDHAYPTGSYLSVGNIQLQTIGGLGIGHIQSTLGLIGVLADSVSKEIYSLKQLEDLMNGTINGLESPKRMLRRMQDSGVSADDAEFLDRMVVVFNALQREARALIVYAKSRSTDDAALFEKSRRLALRKLGELTQQDDLPTAQSNSTNSAATGNK